MPANPVVVRKCAFLTLGTFVLAITTSTWGQTNTPRVMPPHSTVRAASNVSASSSAGEFEVWVVDQSNSPGVSYGGTIHIYEGSDLIGDAAGSAVPTDVVNLGAATAALCSASTGANPVRPHMVYFNSTHTHAVLAFVASGHVVIFDAASRTPLSCIRTSAGAGGARQAHAALPAPDDSYILVANQNGKLLERISTNYSTNTFALNPAATLNLATCMTPNSVACQALGIRPDNAPIFAGVDSSSALGFVTLRGGGMFVVDATATPMAILGEYDKATVHPNGMVAAEVRGWMFVNSGGGTMANLSEFDVYRFPLSGYHASNPPNTPPPEVLFSDDNTAMERDSHGTVATRHGQYLWVGDRAGNVAEVFDTASGAHVNTIDLTGPESDDPTPDYADISPSGNRIFFALRGPTPLTGDPHVATGSTPGLGVVQVNRGGKGGFLKAVVPISNVDATGVERADPHGIRVRLK